ncbi:TorF family putative porin [Paraneptunicella aestuarii]|uniref:TorF family putative porin n=1 Tax=Paraneptunicella aestuarii TaxID=2831148 RepID=UPI001E464971|nr:TorF family putative porin [Paraneptunicella aestuarii]UAA38545.1 TorF family putative porin [Paraneptunicella aestuarii]
MKAVKLSSLAALAITSLAYAQAASAEISANIGLVSEYHFRGIAQTSDASASAGLDYENGGFYVGTWVADVSDGLEVDIYGGYGFEFDNGFGASIGFTTYQYTGDFDSAYNEVNLGLSYGIASIEYSIGTQSDDAALGITESDYTFFALTLEHEGFYGTYGSWGDEFDGDYFEAGYGTEVGGFDVGVSVVISGSDLDDDETILFSIGKSFDL